MLVEFGRKDLDFQFLTPRHLGWLVFIFVAFWGSTEDVYKIWLSLVERARILIFDRPPFFLSDMFKTHLKKCILCTFQKYIQFFFLVKFFHFLCLFKMWEIFTPHPVCIKFKRVETYEML